jgi:glycosyltransferase involved in cell wall biosynthesis
LLEVIMSSGVVRNVAIVTPPESVGGGHRTQAHKTAEALRLSGVTVVECTTMDLASLLEAEVVHGFGISADHVRQARTRGALVAISPIYWSFSYTSGEDERRSLRRSRSRLRMAGVLAVRAGQGRHHRAARELVKSELASALAFESADVLLPNAEGEKANIRRELGISTPMFVVPNSADPGVFTPPDANAPRSGVIYAGRIEPHKNQLGLLQALGARDHPVTIVGPVHPGHTGYARRVADLAHRQGARVLAAAEPGALAELYRSHRAHVVPSWFETTGLVSLEAALTGCAVVSTDRGHAREYLADLVTYCDPADPRSIRKAVDESLRAPVPPELRHRVLARYTWSDTARATLRAYDAAAPSRS